MDGGTMPGSGMSVARAPGPWSMDRPGRPGTCEERAVAGRPGRLGRPRPARRCQLPGVSGSESPKRALMMACLNQGLHRKWVCCRLLATFWPAANLFPGRVVWSSATGGLPALGHGLTPVSTCGTLWPADRRKRPAAIDAGMPSSGRRFRPRSSRWPVFSDAGERETAPPGASLEPLPDKHAGRSRNNAAAGALFYSV